MLELFASQDAQPDEGALVHALMPIPSEMSRGDGFLRIEPGFGIRLSGHEDPRLLRAAARVVDWVSLETGVSTRQVFGVDDDGVKFLIQVETGASSVQGVREDESYSFEVTRDRAVLQSATPYGALRGIETFRQLVRLDAEGFGLPAVRIVDRPRFAWRGLLIDAVRHWIPPAVIMRNLEAMATVKLNVLHWHLTDDQGFRIESRRYPRLHELGSDGRFYTQDEVRRIVEFAGDRGIRVVPEFDMPGHATSWFVGYPELASAPGPYTIPESWGGQEPTMDPTRKEIYELVGGLLDEMHGLFPDPCVHVGGDEINPKQWAANPEIRSFMADNGMTEFPQLHAHFNRRVHRMLEENGRRLIGWDPILRSGPPDGSIVQSVRGPQWVEDAVRQGYEAIAASQYYLTQMRPAAFHYDSDPVDGKCDPVPVVQQDLILGGEASIWTEQVTAENLDARTWPRAAAIAERFWSPPSVRDHDDMYRRLAIVSRRMSRAGLTHETGPRHMLGRMTNDGPDGPLQTLCEVLQPLGSAERRKSRDYSTKTAMNRVVDAVPPESEVGRSFSRRVSDFIAYPRDNALHDEIASQLRTWRDNHAGFSRVLPSTLLLDEVRPLSEALSKVAGFGLQCLSAIRAGVALEPDQRGQMQESLSSASEPVAELNLVIVQSIRQLIDAVTE